MIKAYVNFWKNYANFNGRSRRADYWWAMLCQMIIMMILGMVGGGQLTAAMITGQTPSAVGIILILVYVIFSLASLVPGIAIVVRRLHDIGKSGWWYFIAFVPMVGVIVILVFLCTAGTAGDNMYGPDPKASN